jgi:hypothetical protein
MLLLNNVISRDILARGDDEKNLIMLLMKFRMGEIFTVNGKG